MGLAVPLLNCHWNDVLFLSPIHPSRICDLRVETGYPRVLRRYYQVGPARSGITNDNAVIFRHRIYEPHQNQLPEEDFVPFDSDRLAEYEEIPQKAARYYRKMFRKGAKPLVYLYMPQILFISTLHLGDIREFEIA